MKRLYQVYDLVAATIIGGMIQEVNDAPAIRAFGDALGTKDSILAAHPEDYELRYLGTIDDHGFITDTGPDTIFKGSTWKELKNG